MSEDNSPKFGPCKINYPLYRFVTHLKSIAFCHPRSLQGLDNIAADGATGFQTMERIVDDLKEKGVTGSGAYVHNEDCKRENDIFRLITESTAPRRAHLAKITAENLL